MSIIRVTREFSFEMAHVLKGYDGPCRNVHGHSYRLFVTITGEPVNNNKSPRNGMVLDFTDLKKIVLQTIIDRFDHSVVISNDFAEEKKKMMADAFGNAVIVDYQPTCENLVTDFARWIKNELPAGSKLYSLRLCETAKSYAEWFATDNE
jgi:6-pyruvoyltetrahydropterin/6-carboxytetrahydropterin synthase